MAQIIHKFLENKERGRDIVAAFAAIGGLLLAIAIAVTHFMY